MKKKSTENKEVYDYVIMGSGIGGLSIAALLAKDGKKVCVIEAHDKPGGYSQTISIKGYSFCPGIHYLAGCEKGGEINKFLKKIGLDKKIKFSLLDKDCYNKVVFNDFEFGIPIGIKNYEKKLIKTFPEEREKIIELFNIIRKIYQESGYETYRLKDYLLHPLKHKTTLKYITWTVQKMFDHLKLSSELRAVLSMQEGCMTESPDQALFCVLLWYINTYGKHTSFPNKGVNHFIDSIVGYIKDRGGKIYCNTEINKIYMHDEKIAKVKSKDGHEFHGKQFISNIDPHRTMQLLVGKKYSDLRKKIKYPYTISCFIIFLGLKGIDLRKHGFGKYSIWHYHTSDLKKIYSTMNNKEFYKKPPLFLSSPSYFTKAETPKPEGKSALQLIASANYKHFEKMTSSVD